MSVKQLISGSDSAAARQASRSYFPRRRFYAPVLVFSLAVAVFCFAGKARAEFSNLEAFTGVWCVDFEKTKTVWENTSAKADWTIISVLKEMYHMDVDFKTRTLIEGDIEQERERIPFTAAVRNGKLYMTITDEDNKKKTFVWVDRGDGTIEHDIEGADHSEEGTLIMERSHCGP